MSKKILITGNEAIAEAAIQAGCRFYAGYPITPQNEIPAYMSRRMPEVGGIFIQSESELAAINMVFGASLTGARAMTSSSSPGVSLKQEGISYLAGCELPAVIVNIMRGGPGLGNIAPAQSDYFQATKGGGHGDYHCIVLAPANVKEAKELTMKAFDLADKYRTPVMMLGDGMLGQMMEGVEIQSPKIKLKQHKKPWALTGAKGRTPNVIKSLYLKEGALEEVNQRLQARYKKIHQEEQLIEGIFLDEAEIILVAYGSMGRIAKQTVLKLRKKGLKIGLIRPITLWPFPQKFFTKLLAQKRELKFLVVEMSCGQMLEDVKLAVGDIAPVHFYGRVGGEIPTQEEIVAQIDRLKK